MKNNNILSITSCINCQFQEIDLPTNKSFQKLKMGFFNIRNSHSNFLGFYNTVKKAGAIGSTPTFHSTINRITQLYGQGDDSVRIGQYIRNVGSGLLEVGYSRPVHPRKNN